jgi:MoxR-like ATPase
VHASKAGALCQLLRGRLAVHATQSCLGHDARPDFGRHTLSTLIANSSAETALVLWRARALALEHALNGVVVGQARPIRLLIIAVFARGDVLLEGNVGVGKTVLLRSLARGIGGAYERIEGTVDLMPSDLIYYTYVDELGNPRVAPGPLLKHGEALALFFFNEVNRARPQLHSLLLRVMAERSVTAFNREYSFPHLQVVADRNRVEKEETFELPAAARDRFLMEIAIEPPADPAVQRALMFDPRFHDTAALVDELPPALLPHGDLGAIAALIQRHVRATDTLQSYAVNLCRATADPAAFGVHVEGADAGQLVLSGISPRGSSMLLRAARVAAWLEGRDMLVPEDLHAVFYEAAAHRIFFKPVYELRRSEIAPALVRAILARVPVP